MSACSTTQMVRQPAESAESACLEEPNSGCITIDENSKSPNDGKIQIHYKWLNPFDPKKQTFIFLNGGPGAGSNYYELFQDFWKSSQLGQKFNLLFFDPRGVGRSSPITQSNVANKNMKNYTFDGMVEDIEALRTQLLAGQKIGLIGHSTGGHLVFSYALKYPMNVFKIISLHGAISEMGFLNQYHDRMTEWRRATTGLDQNNLNLLRQKIQSGNACVAEGNPLPSKAWDQLVNYALYGTYSQRLNLNTTLQSLLKGNIDADSYCRQNPQGATASELITGPSANDPLNAMGEINLIINSNVVCTNLMTFNEVESLSPPYLDGTRELWKRTCSNLKASGKITEKPFDVRKDIKKLLVPILIIGADSDQWIAPKAQQEIWNTLSDAQKKISRMTILNKCSHFSFYECPEQLKIELDRFVH